MINLLIIGVGGFAGAVCRYLVSGALQHISGSIAFPFGTLGVNLIGCFLIGVMSQWIEMQINVPTEIRLLFMVGFLGSFTTYSTFGAETLHLIEDHRFWLTFWNVAIHLVIGLAAVLGGKLIASLVWRSVQ